MNILKKYGFNQTALENMQMECKSKLDVVQRAFAKLGIEPDERFDELQKNFEEQVSSRFEQVAAKYTELKTGSESPKQLPLNAVGDCMLAAMTYETAYVLNNQAAFCETNTARFGTRSGVRLNREHGLEEMLKDCMDSGNFAVSIINPEFLTLGSYTAVADCADRVREGIIEAAANAICDIEGREDEENAVAAYKTAIGEAIEDGSISCQQTLCAVSRNHTLCSPQSLEEIAAVVDSRFRELVNKAPHEME